MEEPKSPSSAKADTDKKAPEENELSDEQLDSVCGGAGIQPQVGVMMYPQQMDQVCHVMEKATSGITQSLNTKI